MSSTEGVAESTIKEREPVAVSSILLGQLWKLNETGDTWLVTKLYSEAFSSYAMLRKVGGADGDVRRVKVDKSQEGVTLPGYTFAQEADAF
ncbi:MAG TPA: hypothetical protein VG028_19115 [Terriglobia bacterium]|nr:hypothetical protein [Terriglobia bacterium]